MTRMIDLEKTAYYFIPVLPGEDGIADPDAPTLAEITAGKNISEIVVQSTSIMAAASDTVNERAVTDNANSTAPTIGNYTGDIVLFRQGDELTGEFSDTEDPKLLIPTRGVIFWIVKRTGKKWDAPVAAGDSVETFLFMSDNPMATGGAQDGYLKLRVTGLPQGKFSINAVVAAA